MKKVQIILLIVSLAIGMIACGQDDGDIVQEKNTVENTIRTTSPEEKITLRFSWWGGDSRHEATLAMIDAFERKYPYINVVPEYSGWSGHYDEIATQFVGENEADVMQVNYNWIYMFAPNGEGFHDLKTIGTIDLDNWDEEHVEPLTINDKVMGVPVSVGGRVPYLNKTVFTQAGIEIPETWDDLLESGKIFQSVLGEEYYPWGNIGHTDEMSMIMFSYLAQLTGKNIVSEDNRLSYTKEELIQGFDFTKALLDNHVIPTSYADASDKDQRNVNWIEGKYAGNFQWNSSIGKLVDTLNPDVNPEIVAANYFKLDDSQKHIGAFNKITMALAVSRNTDYPEEAAMLIDFMFTDAEAIEILGLTRAVPVNRVAFKWLEDNGKLQGLQYEGHMKVQEAKGFTIHPYYEDSEVAKAYREVMEQFCYGDLLTSDKAAGMLLEDFNTAMEAAMTRNR